ncbi:MAG: helicase-related protein [Candidatus Omnitrophota bacterium]
MNTDLTFFTNEKGATLLDRFKVTLENNTKFFDVLVGYFRTSAFFSLYKSLEKVEKIRILVGINVDKQTQNLLGQAKEGQLTLKFSHKEVKDAFVEEVSKEMEESEDNSEIELGVYKFIEFIKSGKLEIRAHPSQSIHAKLYIIRKDSTKSEDYGRVITGSSNFTFSGLQENIEFNVELKDSRDVEYALKKFDTLWEQSVPISNEYIEAINDKTWLNDAIKPYELYLKFLYEYFKDKINEDMDSIYKDRRFLPEGYMELEYQDEAVKDALAKLGDYGGVFLADVVGLGKTYISALLAQQLDGYTLIICPPVLKNYWHDTFRDFGVRGFEVESLALSKIDRIIEEGPEKYKNIFIDEAHRFRNETNQTYAKLKQLCWGKRVILVSATPLNNTPFDILSQIKLFQKEHNSTVPNVRDLGRFFAGLHERLKSTDRKNLKEYLAIVKENSQAIRENVLKYLMVRRTRSEVLKYFKKDLDKRKIKFPSVAEPKRVYYEFDNNLENVFIQTIKLIKTFKYSRYMPFNYLKNPDAEDRQEQVSQRNLGRFMKILLVKRLESSFYAFNMTLDRFINSYKDFIDMLNKGNIYISKKYSDKIYEAIGNDTEDSLDELVNQEKIKKYKKGDFANDFQKDLESDYKILLEIKKMWNSVKTDPKIIKFKAILNNDKILKNNKIIIFTESKETAEYLDRNLRDVFGDKIISYSSKSGSTVRDEITANYDPNSKIHKDNIRILITTDVLAEGVNMHRSNVVINYDIPWNPTKVLQRVGRVNRIGTIHDNIYVYNFFPTVYSNSEIKLEEAAIAKIQAFHHTLGEDAQYLTDGEEISSHELFTRLNSKKVLENGEEEERDSELQYLSEIRNVRDANQQLYERIKKLPKKSRSAKFYKGEKESGVTFFRKGKLRKMFIADSQSARELNFFAAARLLKAEASDIREKIAASFYEFIVKNKKAFSSATAEEVRQFGQLGAGSNEKKLIRYTKAIRKTAGFTDRDEEYLNKIITILEDGTLAKQTTKVLIKEIDKETKKEIKKDKVPFNILKKFKEKIPDTFFAESILSSPHQVSSPKEVILSELLIPERKT